MIGTKYVLLVGIQPGAALNAIRQKAKNKKELGPPSINHADPLKLPGENNRDEEERK
jgi:hypothetical protein